MSNGGDCVPVPAARFDSRDCGSMPAARFDGGDCGSVRAAGGDCGSGVAGLGGVSGDRRK